jgi:Uri superfamily endonuclease
VIPSKFLLLWKRKIMQAESGVRSYQLHILVKKPVVITIGKLGPCEFPAGVYVYTGSGKRNIQARVSRHLSRPKKLRWHIDYLLSHSEVHVTGVTSSEEAECTLNRKTSGEILVPRFGATDCRNGCGSHLKYLGVNGTKGVELQDIR